MQDLSGKTAVITGAASGIGLELANQCGAAGMNLVLADIETQALEVATADLTAAGYPVLAHQLDVRDLDHVRALESAARERFGNIHLLCNNAGVGAGGAVANPDDIEVWRWTIDINLWGVIYGCKVFLPAMIEHGEDAHIVNTASMAGLGSAPMMGAYNVSKYGVVALSETLTQEMQIGKTNVGVSVLCPAFVATSIADSQRNLPVELVDAAPVPSSEMQSAIRAMVAGGIPAAAVGAAVLDAVLENKFWILTHAESHAGVTGRADQIVSGVNPAAFGGFS